MTGLCDLRSDLYPMRPEIGKYEKDTARQANAAQVDEGARAHTDQDRGQDYPPEAIAYA